MVVAISKRILPSSLKGAPELLVPSRGQIVIVPRSSASADVGAVPLSSAPHFSFSPPGSQSRART